MQIGNERKEGEELMVCQCDICKQCIFNSEYDNNEDELLCLACKMGVHQSENSF